MVKSMTGFGKGSCSSENVDISVEIKSINSRYFDFSPKTPKLLNNFAAKAFSHYQFYS